MNQDNHHLPHIPAHTEVVTGNSRQTRKKLRRPCDPITIIISESCSIFRSFIHYYDDDVDQQPVLLNSRRLRLRLRPDLPASCLHLVAIISENCSSRRLLRLLLILILHTFNGVNIPAQFLFHDVTTHNQCNSSSCFLFSIIDMQNLKCFFLPAKC